MRRNNRSKFNELTPMGWVVLGGVIVVFMLLVIVAILIIKMF